MEHNEIDLERTEDKYIINREDLNEVRDKVETHLQPYYPDPNTLYVLNTSIYFDSPDLTFLKAHLNKMEDRRKVRIRCYSPNGIDEDIYYIEIKSKSDGKSLKTRLQVDQNGYEFLLKNHYIDINASLIDTNMEMEHDEILKQAKYINYIMRTNKVEPVCKIKYKRNAYQQNEAFRITIDQDIKVTPLTLIKINVIQDLKNLDLWDKLKEYGESFYNQDNFILEIKHNDNDPNWINQMLKDLKAEAQPFSKYVWAMSKIMTHSLKFLNP